MPNTKIFKLSEDEPDFAVLKYCAKLICSGGLVVFPTETVYGIGCNAYDEDALKRLFEAKKRPLDKPLLAHLYDSAQADEIAFPDIRARALMKRFTPGPLTLIVPKKKCIPDIMTSGGDTVGLRFPANRVAIELLRLCGIPVAATSANISGAAAGITGREAAEALMGEADAIIDTGRSELGVPSSIISLVGEPKVIRSGALPEDRLEHILHPGCLKVGLCGRSGSGKGELSKLLRLYGARVIDTDALYHEMIANPSHPCTRALVARFGSGIELSNGAIDRKALRNIVFADSSLLSELNRISHAFVADEVRAIAAVTEGILIIDAPLLFESRLNTFCDVTVAVTAPIECCIDRIINRDGITRADALKRLSFQPDISSFADCVIANGGSKDELNANAANLLIALEEKLYG